MKKRIGMKEGSGMDGESKTRQEVKRRKRVK